METVLKVGRERNSMENAEIKWEAERKEIKAKIKYLLRVNSDIK